MKPIKHKLTDDHDEWLKRRNKGIGGSDAGAVMEVNPYKSAFTLWHEKTGRIDSYVRDNEAMRFGRDMEDYVARRFCEETGKRVQRSGYSFQSADYPWMLANIDRKVVGENAGLECKTANIFAEKIYDEGRIPDSYYCQCLHYMEVCNFDRMYLACYIPQRGLKVFCIERKDALQDLDALIYAEYEFWKAVQENRRPDPDGSESTRKTIAALADTIDFRILPISERVDAGEIGDLVEEIMAVKEDIKSINTELKARESVKNELENKLKVWLEDHQAETAYTATRKISWKETKRTDVDKSRLAERYPEAFEDCVISSTYRRLSTGNIPKKELRK